MKAKVIPLFVVSALLTGSLFLSVPAAQADEEDIVLTDSVENAVVFGLSDEEMVAEADAQADDPPAGLIEEDDPGAFDDILPEPAEDILISDPVPYAGDDPDKCTVAFDSRGGTPVQSQTITKGEHATEPSQPTRFLSESTGFLGWYKEDLKTRFFFSTEVVWEDITLYAKWDPVFFVFSYDISCSNPMDGGHLLLKWVRAGSGGSGSYTDIGYGGIRYSGYSNSAYYLEAQPNVGYLFTGWYKGKYSITPTYGSDFDVIMEPLDLNDSSTLLTEELKYSNTILEDDDIVCAVFRLCDKHDPAEQVTKASPGRDGTRAVFCSKCRKPLGTYTVAAPKIFKLSSSSFTYDGKSKNPSVTVTDFSGKVIDARNYSVSWLNNTMPGTAAARVTFTGNYYEGSKDISFTIRKAAGSMAAKGKTVKVKAAKVRKKKQTIKAAKAFIVTGAAGTVTYSKVKGNKKIKVAANGRITLKKGLKRGTYKVKIMVMDSGSATVNGSEQLVTVKVRVR